MTGTQLFFVVCLLAAVAEAAVLGPWYGKVRPSGDVDFKLDDRHSFSGDHIIAVANPDGTFSFLGDGYADPFRYASHLPTDVRKWNTWKKRQVTSEESVDGDDDDNKESNIKTQLTKRPHYVPFEDLMHLYM